MKSTDWFNIKDLQKEKSIQLPCVKLDTFVYKSVINMQENMHEMYVEVVGVEYFHLIGNVGIP